MVDFTSTLETCAVITTVLQFLSGLPICQQYARNKSTGDSSGFPFICGFLSCSLWLRYGTFTNENIVVYVNIIGAVLMFAYSLTYYVFTINKRNFVKQFVGAVLALCFSIYLTMGVEEDPKVAIDTLGYICCIVTVCFFAAPLTVLLHVIRTKSAESLPLPLIATSFVVSLEWLIYGIIIKDPFIQLPNFLGCILSLSQLSLFVCYPPKVYSSFAYKAVEQDIY
ncbi:swt-4 family protein [Megaselia abdita]